MTSLGMGLSERQVDAILLIACFFIFVVGGVLFTGRTIWKWPAGQTPEFLRWERGFVVAALLVNVLGFALLEDLLRNAGDLIIARLALITYIIGATVVIMAEMSNLSSDNNSTYPHIVLHVVLAFLAQAAFGVALLQTGLVRSWVGWTTIIWNLAWLICLPITSPRDIYFPVLHHVASLLIGIALLSG